MSRSTPIQQLPMGDMADEIADEDNSINQVLEEIEKQNGTTETFSQQPLNNNISPNIYNNPMNIQQMPAMNNQQFANQQFAMNNQMNQQGGINTKLTQEEINKFLADNGVASNSWSIFNIWNTLQSEFKLIISLVIVILLLQNGKFNSLIENNLGFINIPYFDVLMKALVCSILVIVIKKFIS
jgi:hypothetical protein